MTLNKVLLQNLKLSARIWIWQPGNEKNANQYEIKHVTRQRIHPIISHQITEVQLSDSGGGQPVGVHLCSFQREVLIESGMVEEGGRPLSVLKRTSALGTSVCLMFPQDASSRGWFSPLSANSSMNLHQHTASEKRSRLPKVHPAPINGSLTLTH